MRMTRQNSQLLVVDVQTKLVPSLHDADTFVGHCVNLVRAAATLEIPIAISEQYPKGLGHTVSEIPDAATGVTPFEKRSFSCFGTPGQDSTFLASSDRPQLIIAGCESHVCVLQTALDAVSNGINVYVVWDAVTSRSSEDKNIAKNRLSAAGCYLVTSEMVLFEWLETSKHPQFKEVSSIIK